MRIAITGLSGRIGAAFLALAAQRPELRLRALRWPCGLSADATVPVTWVEGDLADPAACDALLRDQDVLVHLAWRGVPLAAGGFVTGLADALVPTLTLFDAVRRRAPLGIVFASSGGTVYAESGSRRPHREEDACAPISPYAIQKLAAEHYLQALCAGGAAAARILRISTAYGWTAAPDAQQGFISIALAAALRGEPVRIVGDPTNVRDFIHRDDVAEALLLAATRSFEQGRADVLNIGSGTGTSVREVLQLIERELGRPVATRLEHWESARGLPGHAVLDISRARNELGWMPHIALQDGIRRGLRDEHRSAA